MGCPIGYPNATLWHVKKLSKPTSNRALLAINTLAYSSTRVLSIQYVSLPWEGHFSATILLVPIQTTVIQALARAFSWTEILETGQVKSISEFAHVGGNADLLQDLKKIAVTGRRISELLAAINLDMPQLDRCEIVAEELGRIYASDYSYFREG